MRQIAIREIKMYRHCGFQLVDSQRAGVNDLGPWYNAATYHLVVKPRDGGKLLLDLRPRHEYSGPILALDQTPLGQ